MALDFKNLFIQLAKAWLKANSAKARAWLGTEFDNLGEPWKSILLAAYGSKDAVLDAVLDQLDELL